MKFELIGDLPKSVQDRLATLEAKDSGKRTTQESAFLTALDPYINNKVIRYSSSNNATTTDLNDLIFEAEGNTVPTGYAGFKHGALFRKLDKTGMNIYINVGDATTASWTLFGQIMSASPSVSPSVSVSDSPRLSVSASP